MRRKRTPIGQHEIFTPRDLLQKQLDTRNGSAYEVENAMWHNYNEIP